MSHFSILIFSFSFVVSLFIGAVIYIQSPKQLMNRLYAVLTIMSLFIMVSNTVSVNADTRTLFWVRGVMVGATVLVAILYRMIVYLYSSNDSENSIKKDLLIVYITTFFIAILDVSPLVFSGLNTHTMMPQANFGIVLFSLHLIIIFTLIISILAKNAKTLVGEQRKQARIMLIGLMPALVVLPITSILFPIVFKNSSLIALVPLYVLWWTVCIGYAVARHGLFDVKIAAVRSVAYFLTLTVLGFIYYLAAFVLSMLLFETGATTNLSFNYLNVALALVLAFLFQPVKTFFDKLTNRIFYKNRYDRDEFYRDINNILVETESIDSLSRRVSNYIGETLGCEDVYFHIELGREKYSQIGMGGRHNIPIKDIAVIDEHNVDRATSAASFGSQSKIFKILSKNKIEVIVPLVAGEKIRKGYLLLGEKKVGHYEKRDILALDTIAYELIIAISNIVALQEVKSLNANLQHKIEDATKELRRSNEQLKKLDALKDEFMSIASHQLRTPLTSIKGYISMMLEGDAGKITKEQEVFLNEAFLSSERMVRLISDFLNVSRLQVGNFSLDNGAVNLKKVIEEELRGIAPQAENRGVKFKYKSNLKKDISITGDESKLRQVIMNYLDNAIFYSKNNTTVTVEYDKVGDELQFKVIDEGMGVPLSEQSRLFTKFFRAKNAQKQRPDGTGIGLFLAKKVITSHGGAIIFESKEGEGSVFGFSLPIG